jgi:glycosyltransferase involved in cell wall biosynthesis
MGGSQLRMAELIEHLGRSGDYHNTVVAPHEGPLWTALEAAGAHVEVRPRVRLHGARQYEADVIRLSGWIDERFDLVCGPTVTSFPAVDAASRLGLPTILRIGEAAPLGTVARWVGEEMGPGVAPHARSAVARASVVVSNCHAALDTYRADGYHGHFMVLSTGVDIPPRSDAPGVDREAMRLSLGIKPDQRVIVCVGTLWPVKGQALLVEALRQVLQPDTRTVCLLIGLTEPGYVDALGRLVEHHGLEHAVRVLPFRADLEPVWRAGDVVACVSESAALPAAVLEGMAHGLPALSCRVGDLPRLVEEGRTGWLCDPSDIGSLARALDVVSGEDDATVQAMGQAAARTIARSYDRIRNLELWSDLVAAVIKGRLPAWARREIRRNASPIGLEPRGESGGAAGDRDPAQ